MGPNCVEISKILKCNSIVKLLFIIIMNKKLEVLDLSTNRICVSGGINLANALENNKTLKYLNLFANQIGIAGGLKFF